MTNFSKVSSSEFHFLSNEFQEPPRCMCMRTSHISCMPCKSVAEKSFLQDNNHLEDSSSQVDSLLVRSSSDFIRRREMAGMLSNDDICMQSMRCLTALHSLKTIKSGIKGLYASLLLSIQNPKWLIEIFVKAWFRFDEASFDARGKKLMDKTGIFSFKGNNAIKFYARFHGYRVLEFIREAVIPFSWNFIHDFARWEKKIWGRLSFCIFISSVIFVEMELKWRSLWWWRRWWLIIVTCNFIYIAP